MYIAIDGNEANISQRVGSNTYAFQLLSHLSRLDKATNYQIYTKQPPLADLPLVAPHWHYRTFGPGKLWTQWRLPLDLFTQKPRPALFFTPGHYAPRFSPVPTVVSIMDLAYLYFPDTFKPAVLSQLKSWTAHSITHARHIFTISESTKKDITKEYPVNPDRITVTYPGSNLTSAPATSPQHTLDKYHLPADYLIFVGTRQPRKNLHRLITALHQVNQGRQHPITLVVVGKVWHQFTASAASSNPHVIYTGYVPDADLPTLVYSARALVMPSLYEGFGIPVLEAMNLGTPVLCSGTSSLPEITGKTPWLFNPTDIQDITSKIATFLQLTPAARQTLGKQGKIRAKLFTWDKCTQKTLEVLHELALS